MKDEWARDGFRPKAEPAIQGDKSDITGFFEADDDVGCARYRRAMARIDSDREARSETREGACSPREIVDHGLPGGVFGWGFHDGFRVSKVLLRGFLRFLGRTWIAEALGINTPHL